MVLNIFSIRTGVLPITATHTSLAKNWSAEHMQIERSTGNLVELSVPEGRGKYRFWTLVIG